MKKSIKYQVSGIRHFAFVFYFSFFIFHFSFSQQLPYYTQFKPNNVMLNPAIIGTKRIFDLRLNYRDQWVGMDGAPVTMGISANSRILNGSMGVGAQYFSDRTGPTKRSDFALAYAYHAHFDDVELSIGAAGHMLSYLVDGTDLHMRVPYDNSIDLMASQKKNIYDLSAGLFFYNDRFHIGVSALNIAEPTVNYYPKSDTVHKTKIRMIPHIYGSVGYNWSGQEDWIWENSLQVVYAEANPMMIDYNLRLHYRQKVFGGISVRLGDAIALCAGATFMDEFHISYSYDFITSDLAPFQGGTHEIMLVWSSNLGMDKKKRYDNNRFKRQKYGYMF